MIARDHGSLQTRRERLRARSLSICMGVCNGATATAPWVYQSFLAMHDGLLIGVLD